MQTISPGTTKPRRGLARNKEELKTLSQIGSDGNPKIENGRAEDMKVSVEFKLSASEARSVAVAGSFNDWNAKKTPMKMNGEVWQAKMGLERGRYEYRFVVDGNWVSDPCAKESSPNPFGTDNSVLRV